MIQSQAKLLPRGVWPRVAASTSLVLALAAISLGSSWALGRAVATIVATAMGGKAYRPDGHHLYALLELAATQPTVGAALVVNLVVAGALAMTLWVFLAGGVLGRLWRVLPASEFVAACVSQSPGMLAHTLWFALLRGVLLFGLVLSPAGLRGIMLLLLALPWFTTVAAHDLVRARWVLGAERRWGPRAALAAIKDVMRRPIALLGVGAVWSAAVAMSAGIALVTLQKMHVPGTIWTLRGLALVPIALGVVRLAIAVERAAEERKD